MALRQNFSINLSARLCTLILLQTRQSLGMFLTIAGELAGQAAAVSLTRLGSIFF
jgi:hypothetical protein